MKALFSGLTASSLWSTMAVNQREFRVWRARAECGHSAILPGSHTEICPRNRIERLR